MGLGTWIQRQTVHNIYIYIYLFVYIFIYLYLYLFVYLFVNIYTYLYTSYPKIWETAETLRYMSHMDVFDNGVYPHKFFLLNKEHQHKPLGLRLLFQTKTYWARLGHRNFNYQRIDSISLYMFWLGNHSQWQTYWTQTLLIVRSSDLFCSWQRWHCLPCHAMQSNYATNAGNDPWLWCCRHHGLDCSTSHN